jgi:hypothetical protein
MSRTITAVIVLALAFAPGVVSAQGVEIGIKGGATFADMPTFADDLEKEGAVDMTYRVGLRAGGFVALRIADRLAFQPELLYAQKGLKGTDPSGNQPFSVELDYVDIPLLLRFDLTPSTRRGWHLLAGPSFNVNVRARAEEDIRDDVEDVEVGLVLGVGFHTRQLLLEGRYEEGLTNVLQFGGDDNYRNRAFTALVGVRFR